MKMFLVFCIVFASLHISLQNPISHWTLLPNILVVEVDGTEGQQPLSCLEPEELRRRDDEGRDIFWMKDDVREAQTGNTYVVELDESFGGGNYTCHSEDGSLLNHTLVLIQEGFSDRKKILVETGGDYLKCFAPNYNGGFRCSWTWHKVRVGKVASITARRLSEDSTTECRVNTCGQRWMCSSGRSTFDCSVDDTGHGIWCWDLHHCPYAEEQHHIYVTVSVRTASFLVESYSKQFYLSNIVKPDKVRLTNVNSSVIEWSYPSSWSSPFSYFPLTFEIAQLKRGCRRCENPCDKKKATRILKVHSTDVCHFKVQRRARAVCVRAKDAFCDSHWSEWSYLRLREPKKICEN